MLTKEDFNELIDKIKSSLDETAGALISEDLLKLIATYSEAIDKIGEVTDEIDKLKVKNTELLDVNGKLFKKIGFDDVKNEIVPEIEPKDETIEIEEIVDEKGDLK